MENHSSGTQVRYIQPKECLHCDIPAGFEVTEIKKREPLDAFPSHRLKCNNCKKIQWLEPTPIWEYAQQLEKEIISLRVANALLRETQKVPA